MIFFPDVNVWIALAVIEHQHHRRALRWYESAAGNKLAFCRVTQMGFLRLLTNQHVMQGDQLTPQSAWERLDDIYRAITPRFAPEPEEIEKSWRKITTSSKGGPNMWTDAYLAAFARAAGFIFVTFDSGAVSPGKDRVVL